MGICWPGRDHDGLFVWQHVDQGAGKYREAVRRIPRWTTGSAACEVGQYPANAWGLHDMYGNEFEWCRDWYHVRLPGGVDPDLYATQGAPNGDGSYSRVRRGGAWTDDAGFCRSALRLRYEPARRADHIGFRVVAVRR